MKYKKLFDFHKMFIIQRLLPTTRLRIFPRNHMYMNTTTMMVKDWLMSKNHCSHCVDSISDFTIECHLRYFKIDINNVEQQVIEELLRSNQLNIPVGPCFMNFLKSQKAYYRHLFYIHIKLDLISCIDITSHLQTTSLSSIAYIL